MIEWSLFALDDLLAIDRFRKRHHLVPIRAALYRAIEDYFTRYSGGTLMPGSPAKDPDITAPDVRKTRVFVGKTGGPYRVFFRYDQRAQVFEVLRVAHPRENARR